MRRSALLVGLLGGCSCNNNAHPDAAMPDAPPIVFMGEYVDFLSQTTKFCGILNATWTVHDRPEFTDMTNPNGRVSLTLPPLSRYRIDITPPTAGSECTNPVGQTYAVPGIAIVDAAVIAANGEYSSRAFTSMEASMFGPPLPGLAQVLIHVDGTPRAVALTAAHDPPRSFTDAAGWAVASSDTGENVFFPNVDPAAGMTTVSVAGGSIGEGSVPVVAGTFTYLSVIAN